MCEDDLLQDRHHLIDQIGVTSTQTRNPQFVFANLDVCTFVAKSVEEVLQILPADAKRTELFIPRRDERLQSRPFLALAKLVFKNLVQRQELVLSGKVG